MVLGEGKTSYCTWGRELIKQYIEDAIELVRTSLATGDWNKCVRVCELAGPDPSFSPLACCLLRLTHPFVHTHSSVEAARRLTLLYLGKASERSIVENEPVLHAEVMNTLGNLWFALLPYMPPVSSMACTRTMHTNLLDIDPPLPLFLADGSHPSPSHPTDSPSASSSGGSSPASARLAGPRLCFPREASAPHRAPPPPPPPPMAPCLRLAQRARAAA